MDNLYQHVELEQVYAQVLDDPNKAIAVCSANAGEGVTSLAQALAKRNLMAGYSTLYVDFNLYHPNLKPIFLSNKIEVSDEVSDIANDLNVDKPISALASRKSHRDESDAERADEDKKYIIGSPQLTSIEGDNGVLVGIVAPTARNKIIKLKQAGYLEKCIAQWKTEYDTIIIDTSPINRINANNLSAMRVASACDGAILSILSGHTTQAMLYTAMEKLKANKVNLIGCVYNDRYSPSLKDELIRQVDRLFPTENVIRHYLYQFLFKNKLLSLEL